MRIVHIMAAKSNGGAETYSTDVMLGLHECGIAQTVVMHEKALRTPMLMQAGLRVNTQILRSSLHPWRRLRLRRFIAREKPDIIHCWMRRAASLISGADARRIPTIGWFGDYEVMKNFAHCTCLVSCTRDIVAHMRRNGIAESRSFYIPTFPTIDDAPALNRAALQTPADAKLVLALSRLDPVKGLDTLIHAMKELPDCYLWLAGEGPSRGELESLTRRLGVEQRVRFLGWRTDRGALLRAADICALPSRYEPFGTVILEAWETGTPLVACSSAGPAAYVQDGRNGLLAPVDDAAALAKALRRVIDDEALRRSLVAAGHEEYRRHYTREAVLQQWIGLYRRLAGQNGS